MPQKYGHDAILEATDPYANPATGLHAKLKHIYT